MAFVKGEDALFLYESEKHGKKANDVIPYFFFLSIYSKFRFDVLSVRILLSHYKQKSCLAVAKVEKDWAKAVCAHLLRSFE